MELGCEVWAGESLLLQKNYSAFSFEIEGVSRELRNNNPDWLYASQPPR